MVVKMMRRWRPWPLFGPKKYEVKLVVKRMEGCYLLKDRDVEKLTVEIRWKGPKFALSSLRRTVKRNFTKEVEACLGDDDEKNTVVEWDEEFQSLCTLSPQKENVFHPWEIAFTVFSGVNRVTKNKVPVLGTALLNLAEYVSTAEQNELELRLPLVVPADPVEPCPVLFISLSLLELRTAPEEPVQRAMVTVSSPHQSGESVLAEKDELSAIKAGLKKVKILTEYVSTRRAKKACHEEDGSERRSSARSEDCEYNYPFDSDSMDDSEEGESDEIKDSSIVRKSFSYGPLAYAKYVGGLFYSDMRTDGKEEDWVYYSNRKSDVGRLNIDDLSTSEPSLVQSTKRSILPWRKRKLSFRSPKARGEPLLKKAYAEEGGDDIDFDRRQLSSDDAGVVGSYKVEEDSSAHRSSISVFGDDNFAVGSWEQKDIVSRDGHMKLQTEVFFASIDQRSERAAGEGACTVLVAVIANWFQNNHHLMPIKSQFDSLIREGSLEWRKLCENENYRERFPDRHFDLETVLQSKICSLSVVPDKSFIGFFHPDGMDEGRFDFLHGAMSFDNIWDEISGSGSEGSRNGEPQVYIVSWNDHFFILMVEPEAYYIIDTLGERLYEGCNWAHILKFDCNTVIRKLPNGARSSEEKAMSDKQIVAVPAESLNRETSKEAGSISEAALIKSEESMNSDEEEDVCRGKDACKEYIKSFLAAIPIRELQGDIRKGLMASTPLHRRLQIEFQYTQLYPKSPAEETPIAPPESFDTAITEVLC